MNEPVKLIIGYNMKPGREEACQRYMVQEFGATVNEFGFQFTGAWYTAWGNGPQIMGTGLLDSAETAREMFASDAWRRVTEGLAQYVDDFSVRVVQPAAAFQI